VLKLVSAFSALKAICRMVAMFSPACSRYLLIKQGKSSSRMPSEEKDVRERVLHFPLLAWITDDGEVLQEAESVHGDHLSLKRQHMITADIDRQSDPSPSRYFFKKCALRCTTWLLVFKFLTRRKPCPTRLFHDFSLEKVIFLTTSLSSS